MAFGGRTGRGGISQEEGRFIVLDGGSVLNSIVVCILKPSTCVTTLP